MRIRCCKAALGRFLFALCALVCLNGSLFAQKKVDYKSDWGERMPSAPDNMVLKGNVVFVHEKMTMLCDSAVFYTAEDFIEAFGSIHIYQDTLHLYGSRADYDTRLRVAQIFGDEVLLLDGKTRLTTDYMVWERDFATVRYTDGAKIQDEENTLTSTLGTYHTDTKVFDFAGEVVVNAASADIFADSLSYASKTDEVFFVCPTRILTSDSILILTSLGTYNTKSREAQLRLDNFVQNSSNPLAQPILTTFLDPETSHLLFLFPSLHLFSRGRQGSGCDADHDTVLMTYYSNLRRSSDPITACWLLHCSPCFSVCLRAFAPTISCPWCPLSQKLQQLR